MYQLPIDLLKEGESIVLYGAGNVGIDFHEQIIYSDYCKINHWIDAKGENEDVFRPDFDANIWSEQNKILIAVADRNKALEIEQALCLSYGVDRSRFLWKKYDIDNTLSDSLHQCIINKYYNNIEISDLTHRDVIPVTFRGMYPEQVHSFLRVFSEYRITLDKNARTVVYGNFFSLNSEGLFLDKNRVNIAYWPGECHFPQLEYNYSFSLRNVGEKNNCFMMGAYDDFELLESRCIDRFNDLYNRRFCNFVYYNYDQGNGAKLRQDFCSELMKYKHVDCPGRVMNNMSNKEVGNRYGDWKRKKIEYLKKYKFTIAFENERVRGNIDEKILQPLVAGSIPIYYGAEDIGDYINKDCFIDTRDFDDDWNAVIERIKEIDNDIEKYLHMVTASPIKCKHFYKKRRLEVNDFIRNMVERNCLLSN